MVNNKDNRVFMSRNYRSHSSPLEKKSVSVEELSADSCPAEKQNNLKNDVLKTNICSQNKYLPEKRS